MHVVHVVPAPFGDGGVVGGAERYAYELARHMSEEVDTSLLTFGAPGKAGEEHRDGKLRVRVLGGTRFVRGQPQNPIAPALVPEVLRADVVHCHQQRVVASTLTALLMRLRGRRVFASELGGGGWDVSAYVSTDRLFHGHLHISEYSRKIAGHEGMPYARVILGGVDLRKFSPPEGEAPPRDRAVFVGRLLPHKGVNDLVEAVPSDLPLELVGRCYDARFAEELRRLARGKRVAFEHDRDDAGIVEAYRRAFCVVLPSVYRTMYGDETRVPELLGQTLLEGMACGAPAICTNVASMPEVVEDGVTGFVVPPNDPHALREKIVLLASRPDLVRSMGEAARRRIAEHFTWEAVVRRCLDAYRGAA